MTIALVLVLTTFTVLAWLHFQKRTASEVLADLHEQISEPEEQDKPVQNNTDLMEQGVDAGRQKRREVICSVVGLFVPTVPQILFGELQFGRLMPAALLGLSAGFLVGRRGIKRDHARWKQDLEFYLPIVMERVVMAVQSGLDVIPGLKAMIELDSKAQELTGTGQPERPDPVTRLLALVCQLTESGLSFESALREVSSKVSCPAIKHAFIHLAVAQREGGELMKPLRELSDSTQLYYQDSVEEQIAKLPVKATMPLLLTFAGLIVCFLTPSVIQVMSTISQGMPK